MMLLAAARQVPVFGDGGTDVTPLSHWTSPGGGRHREDVAMFARFCDDVSVDTNAVHKSLEKMLVVSQKNVNVRTAFAQCFGADAFIDWERVESMWNDRPYQDSMAWVQLMGFVAVRDDECFRRMLLREHPSLRHFDECMRVAGLGADDNNVWASIALYLLVSVRQLHTLHAMELFYSTHFKRGVRREALVFFSEMANKQFDRESHTSALVAVMQRCVSIRGHELQLELELVRTQSLELDMLFRQKMVRAIEDGRPRLRSKLKATDRHGSSLFDMDRLERWTGFIRFPNVFSMKQRKRLYFIMAQCHFAPGDFMAQVLLDHDLRQTVLSYPVKQPDVDVIHQCVADLRVVSDPFPELHLFRARCFDSFAQEHKSRLRLNDLLQLYVAAYQAPSIWKSVWKLVFPVLSIQIIRDVETFVERSPFATRSVLSIMFGLPILEGALPAREGGGFDAVDDDGVVGELGHAVHGVWDNKGAGAQTVDEWTNESAPLEHEVLRGAEPPVVDALIPLEGGDTPLAHPAETEHVVDEEAGHSLLHEESPAEGGARGALEG